MSNIFQRLKVRKPQSSIIDLSHEKKMSLNMGKLYPCYLQSTMPGDQIKLTWEIFMRLAPMVAPMMHNVNLYVHFFWAPHRLNFTGFNDFWTGGRLGTDATVWPKIPFTNADKAYLAKSTLADYLGLPVCDPSWTITNNLNVSAIPFRLYQMIFNEYYRDQNLSAEIAFSKGSTLDAGDLARLCTIRSRAWEKDYFTSSLPWAQRGNPSAVIGTPDYKQAYAFTDEGLTLDPTDGNIKSTGGAVLSATNQPLYLDVLDGVDIDINDLRYAEAVQKWLERNARFGARVKEAILGHFGETLPDYTAQRPEFLGGGRLPVQISEVLASLSDANNDLGDMGGHGLSVGRNFGFSRHFTEFGYIMGILSVLPRTAYSQGVERDWLINDKFDLPFPSLAQLGEQEVLQEEIFHDYQESQDANLITFGYQSRYAEHKFKQSKIAGDFRDNLDHWHMGRMFQSAPELNEAFVTSDPTHRVFAVETETIDKLYAQMYFKVISRRPLPATNIPTL